MSRLRRCILSNHVYEICFRTRKGLPFVCTRYMKLILKSVIARAQRDHKVDISNLLFMGNHPHMLVTARDAVQFKNFYCEVKKQITEMVKKLLGRKHLCLWDRNKTKVNYLEDAETIKDRIVYLFTNPASAHLVDSIEHYPGLSSWEIFRDCENSIHYEHKEDCPWIQQYMVEPLPCKALTEKQDDFIYNKLKSRSKLSHELILKPNCWMEGLFPEDDPEIVKFHNDDIKEKIREKEKELRLERLVKGIKVKGANALKREAFDLKYRPKKYQNSVFVICRDVDLRKQILGWYREFCEQCAWCYEQWKAGNFRVKWPPGAYAPVGVPNVNLLEFPI